MVMFNLNLDNDYRGQETDSEIITRTTFQDSNEKENIKKTRGASWKPAQSKYDLELDPDKLSSNEVRNDINSFMNTSVKPTQNKSDKDFSSSVLRIHYIELILKALNEIVKNREEPTFLVNIHSLLWTLIETRDTILLDPLIEVTSAFYDALKSDNNWKNFNAEQYQAVIKVFEKIGKQRKLSEKIIAKSIQQLEESGFDTTPYAADIMEQDV